MNKKETFQNILLNRFVLMVVATLIILALSTYGGFAGGSNTPEPGGLPF